MEDENIKRYLTKSYQRKKILKNFHETLEKEKSNVEDPNLSDLPEPGDVEEARTAG